MKYEVGDQILVLHSNEEGRVVEIINEKMVLVEVRGVRFPAYMDQIDFPYFKRFTEQRKIPAPKQKRFVDEIKKEKVVPAKDRTEDGVWLTFLPVMDTDEFGDEVVEDLKIHLINRTSTALDFVYKLNYQGVPAFELKNNIQPFQDFYIHDVPFEDMNDNPAFDFDFSLVQPQKGKAEHFETSLKLRAKQIFTKIEELKKKNQAHFSYRLFEKYPDRAIEPDRLELGKLAAAGFKIYNAKEARQHLEPARSVVDLHIEKLTEDWEHLSNYEILSIQLKTFEKYYELALAHHQATLIVIHGVGKGKLRDELHDILRLKREVKSFVNQYDARFGYGATEIFFK
ncbi:MAG: Smr/MutS family protein [Chitinophagaceae bacterium]